MYTLISWAYLKDSMTDRRPLPSQTYVLIQFQSVFRQSCALILLLMFAMCLTACFHQRVRWTVWLLAGPFFKSLFLIHTHTHTDSQNNHWTSVSVWWAFSLLLHIKKTAMPSITVCGCCLSIRLMATRNTKIQRTWSETSGVRLFWL